MIKKPVSCYWIVFFLFCLGSCLFVNPAGDVMSETALATSVNLVDRGTLQISPDSGADICRVNGKYYCGLGPGTWLIPAPFYFFLRRGFAWIPDSLARDHLPLPNIRQPSKAVYLLRIFMVWLLLAPLAALSLTQMFRFILESGATTRAALSTILACGLGSLILPYSSVYSKQCLAAALVWNALFWNLNAENLSIFYRFVTGAIFGFAVTVDYPTIFLSFAAASLLFVSFKPRERWFCAGGFFAVMLLLGLFHYVMFGNPFLTPYHFRSWPDYLRFSYKGQQYTVAQLQLGLFLGFRHPTLASLYGLTFSPFKGVFFFCPALFCGVWGHLKAWSDRRFALLSRISVLSLAIYILFFSSLNGELYWSGVPVYFGPRYLLAPLPLALLGMMHFKFDSQKQWYALFGLLGLSIAFNLLGAMYHHRMIACTNLEFPGLQAPIFWLLGVFFRGGPRIPLLDAYGIGPGIQGIVFCLYVVALFVGFYKVYIGLRSTQAYMPS